MHSACVNTRCAAETQHISHDTKVLQFWYSH